MMQGRITTLADLPEGSLKGIGNVRTVSFSDLLSFAEATGRSDVLQVRCAQDPLGTLKFAMEKANAGIFQLGFTIGSEDSWLGFRMELSQRETDAVWKLLYREKDAKPPPGTGMVLYHIGASFSSPDVLLFMDDLILPDNNNIYPEGGVLGECFEVDDAVVLYHMLTRTIRGVCRQYDHQKQQDAQPGRPIRVQKAFVYLLGIMSRRLQGLKRMLELMPAVTAEAEDAAAQEDEVIVVD